MKKKCPVCNSTKTNENKRYFTCDYCGYIHKKPLSDNNVTGTKKP